MINDPNTHLIGCPFRDGDANPCLCLCPEPEKHREGHVLKREKAKFETAFGPEDTWEESDAKA